MLGCSNAVCSLLGPSPKPAGSGLRGHCCSGTLRQSVGWPSPGCDPTWLLGSWTPANASAVGLVSHTTAAAGCQSPRVHVRQVPSATLLQGVRLQG